MASFHNHPRVQKIQSLVRRNEWKKAYKEAVFLAKQSGSSEARALIVSSLWGWIKDQVRRDQFEEARENVQELLRQPSIPVADIIEGILAERITDPNQIELPEMRYPFWPYTRGIVEDLETMKKLEPYFCTQGSVFKAQVIGRFDEVSPVVRLEV